MTKLRKGLSALLLSAFMTLGVGIGIGTKSVVEGRATNNVALTFPDENKASNKQTSYSNSWNAKIGSNTWEIKNFNNNTWNNSWTYIKCGSKKTASVGSITNTTAIEKIDTIVVTVDNVTVDNVNNFYITCGKTSTSINENKIDLTIAKGENVFSLSNNEYSYFSIFVDCKKSSNGTVQISKVEYKCTLPVEPTKIESVEFSDPSKVFYCGDTINKSDFVVKDDVGDVVENFDIDVTEVPSNPGSFNITFTSEGLESKTVSFTANTTAKSVTITPEVLNITQGYVGHTEQLTALVAYNNNESTDNNVTWLSSDATASIDNTGLLILNSESGTATITATAKIKGTNNSIISNSITVTWSNLKDQSFKKMTSDTVLKTGYKVIITNSNASAVMGYYEDGKNNIGEITNGFTLKNDSITVKSDTKCIYTLVGDSTTGFSFKDENNLYIYAASSSSNQLKAQSTIDDNAKFDITYTVSGITIKAKGKNTRNQLQYNSGSNIFSCYSGGQQAVQLYVQAVNEKTLNISEESLSGIVGQGATEIKAVYENWTPTTFNWTSSNETVATIEGGETATITPLSYGETTISLSASDGTNTLDASNTCKYSVTVLPEEIKLYISDTETYEISLGYGSVKFQSLPKVKILPEGSNQDVNWSIVSGENFISLANTRYNINAAGTAIIRATSTVNSNVYKDFTIIVTPNVVESLSVTGTPSIQYTSTNLDLTGLTFTAKMSNTGDTVVNTNDIAFSPATMPSEPTENLEITATYGEKSCTFNVSVEESPKGFALLTDASLLNAGDKIVFARRDKGALSSSLSDSTSKHITSVSTNYLQSDTTFLTIDNVMYGEEYVEVFTLGGQSGQWTIADSNGTYINAKSGGGLEYTEGTWSINISSDNYATVKSNTASTYSLYYNSQSQRFTVYNNTNMLQIEIFYMTKSTFDSSVNASMVSAMDWARSFNDNVITNCDVTGVAAPNVSNWETPFDLVTELDQTTLNYLINLAGNRDGNLLEKSIWYYDYIISKYGDTYVNYLDRNISKSNPINIINSANENIIPLIVIVSLVSVSTIGGYFFIRKRKEQ